MRRRIWLPVLAFLLVATSALAGCNEPQETGLAEEEPVADDEDEWPEVQVEDADETDVQGGEKERLEPDDPVLEEGIEPAEDEVPPPEDREAPEVE